VRDRCQGISWESVREHEQARGLSPKPIFGLGTRAGAARDKEQLAAWWDLAGALAALDAGGVRSIDPTYAPGVWRSQPVERSLEGQESNPIHHAAVAKFVVGCVGDEGGEPVGGGRYQKMKEALRMPRMDRRWWAGTTRFA
jgi:hypothetical protein